MAFLPPSPATEGLSRSCVQLSSLTQHRSPARTDQHLQHDHSLGTTPCRFLPCEPQAAKQVQGTEWSCVVQTEGGETCSGPISAMKTHWETGTQRCLNGIHKSQHRLDLLSPLRLGGGSTQQCQSQGKATDMCPCGTQE